ncbi:hypothetical protein M011DRAFT_462754 [Sporormia fimetaria CBS 119925]|uniref:Uncharacterized protein n=1 Tax=Sporormia fimetaria CBS 119925 TaxID=1340428 RepID=A0A6A6UUW3_9PLEO|nr:hypothetical protein M011DRAFT_462754 [Sporormia fimetaria CBS 119925]
MGTNSVSSWTDSQSHSQSHSESKQGGLSNLHPQDTVIEADADTRCISRDIEAQEGVVPSNLLLQRDDLHVIKAQEEVVSARAPAVFFSRETTFVKQSPGRGRPRHERSPTPRRRSPALRRRLLLQEGETARETVEESPDEGITTPTSQVHLTANVLGVPLGIPPPRRRNPSPRRKTPSQANLPPSQSTFPNDELVDLFALGINETWVYAPLGRCQRY